MPIKKKSFDFRVHSKSFCPQIMWKFRRKVGRIVANFKFLIRNFNVACYLWTNYIIRRIRLKVLRFGVPFNGKAFYQRPHQSQFIKFSIQTFNPIALFGFTIFSKSFNKFLTTQTKLNYLMSHKSATPRSVQCLGLKSVSKSIDPTYFWSVRWGFL